MLLALDSATRHSGIALYDGQQIVAELNWRSLDAQTSELLPRLEQLMAWHGLQPTDLSALAVSLGPGSYTGLRVAVSLAKGLALSHRLPLLGVPTLDATAYGHLGCPEPLCALVQAGRGRVCWAIYRPGSPGEGEVAVELGSWRGRRTTYALSDGPTLAGSVERGTRFVGELAAELRGLLASQAGLDAVLVGPAAFARRAACIAELGWLRWQAGQADDPASLSPIYLREP